MNTLYYTLGFVINGICGKTLLYRLGSLIIITKRNSIYVALLNIRLTMQLLSGFKRSNKIRDLGSPYICVDLFRIQLQSRDGIYPLFNKAPFGPTCVL